VLPSVRNWLLGDAAIDFAFSSNDVDDHPVLARDDAAGSTNANVRGSLVLASPAPEATPQEFAVLLR